MALTEGNIGMIPFFSSSSFFLVTEVKQMCERKKAHQKNKQKTEKKKKLFSAHIHISVHSHSRFFIIDGRCAAFFSDSDLYGIQLQINKLKSSYKVNTSIV